MGKPTPDKHQTSDQARRFIETARQLECDEDKDHFEEKLKRIARQQRADSDNGQKSKAICQR